MSSIVRAVSDAVRPAVVATVMAGVASPHVPLQATAPVVAVEQSVAELADAAMSRAAPELQGIADNLGNREPWYQSRIFWTALFTLLGTLTGGTVAAFVKPELREALITLALLLSPAVAGPIATLWARFLASPKPLGA